MKLPIPDRTAAGRALGRLLTHHRHREDPVVLGLPRGGVPVAAEIAAALDAPRDVLVVRKLGLPGHEELAMGAIASGGVRVMNEEVVRGYDVDAAAIEAVARREEAELQRRERTYRGERPYPALEGRRVILVDDGLATGATMHAAIDAVRARQPAFIVVAIPVAPPDTVARLARLVDEIVCPAQPEPFFAIGQWYVDFDQTSDAEVEMLLSRHRDSGDGDTPRRH